MNIRILDETAVREVAQETAWAVVAQFRDDVAAPLPQWMTMNQVCAYLQVSRPTVLGFVEKGMQGSKISGDWRFNRDDVDRFMREKGNERD